jgi:cyanate lyase
MNLSEASKQLLDAKREKNLTFADIGQKLGRDEVKNYSEMIRFISHYLHSLYMHETFKILV